MFQVGYTEGVPICISTSCPGAVNLKAKHNPLVFLFPPALSSTSLTPSPLLIRVDCGPR
jgi:hypothetical protein